MVSGIRVGQYSCCMKWLALVVVEIDYDNTKFGGGFWVDFGRCTYEDWRWHGFSESFDKRVVYIGGLGQVARGRCSG